MARAARATVHHLMNPRAWFVGLLAIAACGGQTMGTSAGGPGVGSTVADAGFSCPAQGSPYHCLSSASDAPCASPANGFTCPQGTQCYLSNEVSSVSPPGIS